MDRSTFWRIVEETRPANNSPAAHCRKLTALLAKRTPEEIVGFGDLFWRLDAAAYRADLWSVVYEIRGGCSDDSFAYFRWWLLMQGQDVLETALVSPEYLAEISTRDLPTYELYASVAEDAYARRTGQEEMPDDLSHPGYRLKGRFLKTERALKRKFPMLWRLLHEAPAIDPGWLKWQGGTVKKLAAGIHKGRRWGDLPVLADVLEEAGCRDPFLLGHCREGRRHARSCWVTNFLLGKR
jgi:hypothetical protein